ncbi:MAG: S8 family peptidase [Gemmatimonadaceae bacterium]
MRIARTLAMPWAPSRQCYCAPGRLVFKVALGQAPEKIPTIRDVRTGYHEAARTFDRGHIDRVLARFSSDRAITRLHGAAASRHHFGARHLRYDDLEHAFGMSRTFRVSVDHDAAIDDLVDALQQVAHIELAMPHYLCLQSAAPAAALPNEDVPLIDAAWASRDAVRTREALDFEPGDDTIIVAVVDTGVFAGHPELTGRLRAGFDTVQIGPIDVAAGMQLGGDLLHEDMEPDDEVGHGTGCAGIIGARGSTLPRGLAGDSKLLALRVLGSATLPGKKEPVGVGALPDIDDGLKRAIDLRASVLNLSFGTSLDALDENDPLPHQDVVNYGLARGCVMVAASGNTGRDEVFSPACLEGVIAVGAVNDAGEPSAFSTRSDHVALSAPGERVVSAGLTGDARLTGTSFAAPFVSAAAALLLAHANRYARPLGVFEIARLLRETARPFPHAPRAGHGAGVLDAAAALRRLDAEIHTMPPTHSAAVSTPATHG